MKMKKPGIMAWVTLMVMVMLVVLTLPTASCEVFSLEELWEQAKEKEWKMKAEEPITLSHANSIFEICKSWTKFLGDWSPSDSSFVRMTRIMSSNTSNAADLVYNTLRNKGTTWSDLYPVVESAKDAFDMKELAHVMQTMKESVAEPGGNDPWYFTPTFSTLYEKWEMCYLTLGKNLPMEGWPENNNPVMTGLILKKESAEFFVVKLTPMPMKSLTMNPDVFYETFDLEKTQAVLSKVQDNLMKPEVTLEFEVNFGMHKGSLKFQGLYHLKAWDPQYPKK